jgi:hypothetical protein
MYITTSRVSKMKILTTAFEFLYLAYITMVLGVDTKCSILEGWKTGSYVAKMGQHSLRQ